ncbi:MAG: sugar phosphate isomerase/epimerase family protein [Planctomycetaceae bacterium]
MSEEGDHLKPSVVGAKPEEFINRFRDITRLSPVAICLDHDVEENTFIGIAKLCKAMKITQITAAASPLWTPFNSEIDRLRNFIKITNQNGIRLSLKTMAGKLTEDPHTAVELCQSVPGLGITLDPSYFMCGPYKNQSYDHVFPYVYHVHLRDSKPGEFQMPIGLGDLDYSRLITFLQKQGYNRALSVEILPEMLEGIDRSLELRKLRMLLETLL